MFQCTKYCVRIPLTSPVRLSISKYLHKSSISLWFCIKHWKIIFHFEIKRNGLEFACAFNSAESCIQVGVQPKTPHLFGAGAWNSSNASLPLFPLRSRILADVYAFTFIRNYSINVYEWSDHININLLHVACLKWCKQTRDIHKYALICRSHRCGRAAAGQ